MNVTYPDLTEYRLDTLFDMTILVDDYNYTGIIHQAPTKQSDPVANAFWSQCDSIIYLQRHDEATRLVVLVSTLVKCNLIDKKYLYEV